MLKVKTSKQIQNIQDIWDTMKRLNLNITQIEEGKKNQADGTENIFNDVGLRAEQGRNKWIWDSEEKDGCHNSYVPLAWCLLTNDPLRHIYVSAAEH